MYYFILCTQGLFTSTNPILCISLYILYILFSMLGLMEEQFLTEWATQDKYVEITK